MMSTVTDADNLGGQHVPMLLGTVSAALVLVWAVQKHLAGPRKPPPGPWGLPLVGYLPFLEKDIYPSFVELGRKYGPVFQLFMGTRRAVVVNDLDSAKQVLVKQSGDFADRPSFDSYKHFAEGKSLSFGIFDEKGKLMKKLVRSALRQFTLSSENPLENTIWEEANLLLDDIQKASSNPVEIQAPISMAVASVIYRMCFGSETVARQDEAFLNYVEASEALHHVQDPHGNPSDLMPWYASFDKMRRKARADVTVPIVNYFRKQREIRRAEYDPDVTRHVADALIKGANECPTEDLEAAGLERQDALIMLTELISGGRETVAATLSWSILYMVTNPKVQERLQVEIDNNLEGELPHPADRKKMPYVEAFLLETWRRACLDVFLLPHAASRDTKLYGYDIPQGTVIYVNMYGVNHDPKVWPNPMTFDPTRFLDPEGQVDKNKAENVMAFGAGKRRCIGELMGRQESFIMLVMLCKKFVFEKVPGVTYDVKGNFGMTLLPNKYEYIVRERR